MKLGSFRELLLKKSDGDPALNAMARLVREDALADMVMESLEKMARARHKGDAANLAIRDFGLEMDPELEPTMIHSALSHHASRYKAALKHMANEKDPAEKEKLQDVFNHHAGAIYNLVNMAEKTQKHTDGKLSISAPSPHAWERNIKPDQFKEDSKPVLAGKKKVGQFSNDTKGWNYSGNYKKNRYEFLTQEPHPHYKAEAQREGWDSPYPMESIKINDKHIHVDDNIEKEDLMEKKGHLFDEHPIMDHYGMSAKKRTPEHDANYRAAHDKFQDETIHDEKHGWWDHHESLPADHGASPSEPVHVHGVKLFGKGQTPPGGSDEK